MPEAITKIRDHYDPAWVDRRVGQWLETFYSADIVAVFDADDRIEYFRSRLVGEAAPSDLPVELGPALAVLRRHLSAPPPHAVIVTPPNPAKPTNAVALLQRFYGQPTIVAAVAVGEEASLARGNDRAPIVASIKYMNDRLLTRIGERLQVDGLRMIEDDAPSGSEQIIEVADAERQSVARFAWRPKRPGEVTIVSIVPFVAVALVSFALLLLVIMRHMRRTAAAIAGGERRLRHLALHDPVCGLPNRIYFSERLERSIAEVRGGGLTAAVFYIDLDHFKDVNDTLGHHIGDDRCKVTGSAGPSPRPRLMIASPRPKPTGSPVPIRKLRSRADRGVIASASFRAERRGPREVARPDDKLRKEPGILTSCPRTQLDNL